MVRRVLDEAARAGLVSNIIGHLKDEVPESVLARALDYRCDVDKDLGDRVAARME
jgi:catalase